MPIPSEHKTVQAQILEFGEAIGWTVVSRVEAERRLFVPQQIFMATEAIGFSSLLHDLMTAKIRVHDLELPIEDKVA